MVASVPEEVMRTISTDGTRRAISSARSTSPCVGAPNVVPALGRRDDRREHRGVGVAEDERPPRAHVVDVVVAVDVDDLGAVAALDEDRVAADGAHRAHRRVDAAGQALQRAGVELGRAGVGERDGHQTRCVLAFPGLEVLGEVQEADLLELGRAVERRAVLDLGVLAGDRVEDRVALLLGAPVGHGEDRVAASRRRSGAGSSARSRGRRPSAARRRRCARRAPATRPCRWR